MKGSELGGPTFLVKLFVTNTAVTVALQDYGFGRPLNSKPCVSTADWKYRHAGLMALSAIGEGCHQQMEAILNEIVSFVLLFCQDPVSSTQPGLLTKHCCPVGKDNSWNYLPCYICNKFIWELGVFLLSCFPNAILLTPSLPPFTPPAPQSPLCRVQRHRTDGHRLRPHLPKEIPR